MSNKKEFNFDIIDNIAERVDSMEAKADFNLLQIPLEQIQPNPKNKFGMRDIDKLAESLDKFGQFHNIVVRKIEDPEKPYRLISGERRWRAATQLGWKTLIGKIVECDDIDEEIYIIITNLDTRELNDIERSENAQRLVELINEKRSQGVDFGGKKTREIVADKMNIAPATVQKLIGLKNLIPEFHSMVENKEIGLELANQYAQMGKDVQILVYQSLQEGLKLTAKTAKELKDKLKKTEEDFEKVIDEMKEQITNKDNAIKQAKEEAESKTIIIESLNKELQEAKEQKLKKEKEMEHLRDNIKAELQEELEKEYKDDDKILELENKLKNATSELEKAQKKASDQISRLERDIESLEESKDEIIDSYEKKIKEASSISSINEDNIIKNVEITALAKQVTKIMTSLIGKVSEVEVKEEYYLSNDSKNALNHLTELIEVIKPKTV